MSNNEEAEQQPEVISEELVLAIGRLCNLGSVDWNTVGDNWTAVPDEIIQAIKTAAPKDIK